MGKIMAILNLLLYIFLCCALEEIKVRGNDGQKMMDFLENNEALKINILINNKTLTDADRKNYINSTYAALKNLENHKISLKALFLARKTRIDDVSQYGYQRVDLEKKPSLTLTQALEDLGEIKENEETKLILGNLCKMMEDAFDSTIDQATETLNLSIVIGFDYSRCEDVQFWKHATGLDCSKIGQTKCLGILINNFAEKRRAKKFFNNLILWISLIEADEIVVLGYSGLLKIYKYPIKFIKAKYTIEKSVDVPQLIDAIKDTIRNYRFWKAIDMFVRGYMELPISEEHTAFFVGENFSAKDYRSPIFYEYVSVIRELIKATDYSYMQLFSLGSYNEDMYKTEVEEIEFQEYRIIAQVVYELTGGEVVYGKTSEFPLFQLNDLLETLIKKYESSHERTFIYVWVSKVNIPEYPDAKDTECPTQEYIESMVDINQDYPFTCILDKINIFNLKNASKIILIHANPKERASTESSMRDWNIFEYITQLPPSTRFQHLLESIRTIEKNSKQYDINREFGNYFKMVHKVEEKAKFFLGVDLLEKGKPRYEVLLDEYVNLVTGIMELKEAYSVELFPLGYDQEISESQNPMIRTPFKNPWRLKYAINFLKGKIMKGIKPSRHPFIQLTDALKNIQDLIENHPEVNNTFYLCALDLKLSELKLKNSLLSRISIEEKKILNENDKILHDIVNRIKSHNKKTTSKIVLLLFYDMEDRKISPKPYFYNFSFWNYPVEFVFLGNESESVSSRIDPLVTSMNHAYKNLMRSRVTSKLGRLVEAACRDKNIKLRIIQGVSYLELLSNQKYNDLAREIFQRTATIMDYCANSSIETINVGSLSKAYSSGQPGENIVSFTNVLDYRQGIISILKKKTETYTASNAYPEICKKIRQEKQPQLDNSNQKTDTIFFLIGIPTCGGENNCISVADNCNELNKQVCNPGKVDVECIRNLMKTPGTKSGSDISVVLSYIGESYNISTIKSQEDALIKEKPVLFLELVNHSHLSLTEIDVQRFYDEVMDKRYMSEQSPDESRYGLEVFDNCTSDTLRYHNVVFVNVNNDSFDLKSKELLKLTAKLVKHTMIKYPESTAEVIRLGEDDFNIGDVKSSLRNVTLIEKMNNPVLFEKKVRYITEEDYATFHTRNALVILSKIRDTFAIDATNNNDSVVTIVYVINWPLFVNDSSLDCNQSEISCKSKKDKKNLERAISFMGIRGEFNKKAYPAVVRKVFYMSFLSKKSHQNNDPVKEIRGIYHIAKEIEIDPGFEGFSFTESIQEFDKKLESICVKTSLHKGEKIVDFDFFGAPSDFANNKLKTWIIAAVVNILLVTFSL